MTADMEDHATAQLEAAGHKPLEFNRIDTSLSPSGASFPEPDAEGSVAVADDPPHQLEGIPRLVSTGQPKITGYRELSPAEVALMQRIKAMGAELEELTEAVADQLYGEMQAGRLVTTRESKRGTEELDLTSAGLRWLEFGTVDLQKGLMFLTRAVARPTSF